MIQGNITGYFHPNSSKILESGFIIRSEISRATFEYRKNRTNFKQLILNVKMKGDSFQNESFQSQKGHYFCLGDLATV